MCDVRNFSLYNYYAQTINDKNMSHYNINPDVFCSFKKNNNYFNL